MLKDAAQLMYDIDLRRPFVLYIHGFNEDMSADSIEAIVTGDHIFIIKNLYTSNLVFWKNGLCFESWLNNLLLKFGL